MNTILYSCPQCGLKNCEVKVPYREASEDVVAWVKQVVEIVLASDHRERSPTCRTDKLCEVKIPITGVGWIGGPPLS